VVYADGHAYADGGHVCAEGPRRRRRTPRAAVGVAYAEGKAWLRRGQPAVGVPADSCSELTVTIDPLRPLIG
jgi:hypothetical protein